MTHNKMKSSSRKPLLIWPKAVAGTLDAKAQWQADLRYYRNRLASAETALTMAEDRLADLRTSPRHIHEAADLIADAASDAASAAADIRFLRQKIANIRALADKRGVHFLP